MDTNTQWWYAPAIAPETPPAEPEPTIEPRPPQSAFRRRLSALGAAIVALVAKFKTILLLLPKLKLFASSGTIFVSLVAYAVIWGWPFAAGFIALLFVHEMGHVIALAARGHQGQRADVHPVPGCGCRRSLTRQ